MLFSTEQGAIISLLGLIRHNCLRSALYSESGKGAAAIKSQALGLV
jgi:hypothetical protein